MADQSSTVLLATRRDPAGSRDARRLRRTGLVPGVVYGGDGEPVSFSVNARELRQALANAGAVLDLQIEGEAGTPVVLKELIRHPVSGATTHIDLLRVRLDVKIQSQVTVELTGTEDAPGVKQGGILEHVLREVTVEALPTAIPDSLPLDISELDVGNSISVSAIAAPAGVEIVSDPDATVVTITASRASRAGGADELETETEVVGEGESDEADAESEAQAGDDSAEE
jgi:large subunit ribosomal protein L25